MQIELADMGLTALNEVPVPVAYRGREVSPDGLRIDLLVENAVIVELKSVEKVQPVHEKQLYTYLRLTGKPLGLLINFNEPVLKTGIRRIINRSRSGAV